jgi:hydroxypyruvate isomerase
MTWPRYVLRVTFYHNQVSVSFEIYLDQYTRRSLLVHLSCCLWALSGPDDEILTKLAAAGFDWVDVRPFDLKTEAARTKLRQLGLGVTCIAISFGLPKGAALDSPDPEAVSQALTHTKAALAHGAELGATAAYVVPGMDGSQAALDRYARSLAKAADRAASAGLKLCVEHFPGRALPTASATLDFLRAIDHPNLYLLFDIGHIQMAGEDPAETITTAGPRLGYVHLDDNDGRHDQHLALLDGVLTEATLRRTFAALTEAGYAGPVSLELNPQLPDPLEALQRSRDIVGKVAQIG